MTTFTAGGSNDDLYDKLKQVPHVTVYQQADIPRGYRYTYNQRILPLLVVADDHWQICAVRSQEQCWFTGESYLNLGQPKCIYTKKSLDDNKELVN